MTKTSQIERLWRAGISNKEIAHAAKTTIAYVYTVVARLKWGNYRPQQDAVSRCTHSEGDHHNCEWVDFVESLIPDAVERANSLFPPRSRRIQGVLVPIVSNQWSREFHRVMEALKRDYSPGHPHTHLQESLH